MLDVRAIARCLPRHFARAVLLVLALCCLQAVVMRWGPSWMNLVNPTKPEISIFNLSLSADRRSALTQISIAPSLKKPPGRLLFMHRTEEPRSPQRLLPDRTDIRCAAMTRDASRVAVATRDGLVQILTPDLAQATAIDVDRVAPDWINQIQWTRDGSKLVALSTDFIYVWLYPECRRLHRLARSNSGATRMELAADSESLFLFNRNQYDVWDLERGYPVKTVELPSIAHAVALSTDSRFAALVLDGGLCVWDCDHEREVWQHGTSTHNRLWQPVAISPDDSLVASIQPGGDTAPRIAIQRLSDGQPVAMFNTDVDYVTAIAFVSNTQLWVCGHRGIIEAREIANGNLLWRHDVAAAN